MVVISDTRSLPPSSRDETGSYRQVGSLTVTSIRFHRDCYKKGGWWVAQAAWCQAVSIR